MPATAYERVVYKSPSEYHYMKVCLEFQEHGVGLNGAQFKQLLVSALKDLFGEWSGQIVELFDPVWSL